MFQPPTQPPPWRVPTPLPESLETPRLRLRYWRGSDAPAMLEAINADRPSFLPWLPWAETDNHTLEQCIFNIERFRRERTAPDAITFGIGIFDRATDAPRGGTSFHAVNPATHEAEIGYWVDPRHRAKGFCTEAVAHLISWGFTPQSAGGWGFRRLHIRCAAANHASAAVPRKLNLPLEATLRQERWVPGHGWTDSLAFSVLAHEWDTTAHRLKAH